MSTLREYLQQKRDAILARRAKAADQPPSPHTLSARVKAEGRSGVRRIRIRDFQIISDSGPDFAGYDLGPSSPELQLGILGSCLTHIFLIQAADRGEAMAGANGYANTAALTDNGRVAAHKGDGNVRLIEVDVDTTAYDTGHIPGAIGWHWQHDLQRRPVRDIPAREEWGSLQVRHDLRFPPQSHRPARSRQPHGGLGRP
jgi:hypothetical protein